MPAQWRVCLCLCALWWSTGLQGPLWWDQLWWELSDVWLKTIYTPLRPTFMYPCLSLCSSSGTAVTRGSPGLQNQTSPTGRPGFHGDSTTGAPGLHTTRSQGGLPGMSSPGITGQPGLQRTTTSSMGMLIKSTFHSLGFYQEITFFPPSLGVIHDQVTGPPDHQSTLGSPQVNLDYISPQPSILEDLGCKPQKVRDMASLLVILQPDRTHGLNFQNIHIS